MDIGTNTIESFIESTNRLISDQDYCCHRPWQCCHFTKHNCCSAHNHCHNIRRDCSSSCYNSNTGPCRKRNVVYECCCGQKTTVRRKSHRNDENDQIKCGDAAVEAWDDSDYTDFSDDDGRNGIDRQKSFYFGNKKQDNFRYIINDSYKTIKDVSSEKTRSDSPSPRSVADHSKFPFRSAQLNSPLQRHGSRDTQISSPYERLLSRNVSYNSVYDTRYNRDPSISSHYDRQLTREPSRLQSIEPERAVLSREEARRRRKKSSVSGSGHRRKISQWSLNNTTYNNGRTNYNYSINGNNSGTPPVRSGYLMPTVGCHCTNCLKVFGNRSSIATTRKKSKTKQQQLLHQQLQFLLKQQQQIQQEQEQSKQDQVKSQPQYNRSFGLIDADVIEAPRKISSDSAVSMSSPESICEDLLEEKSSETHYRIHINIKENKISDKSKLSNHVDSNSLEAVKISHSNESTDDLKPDTINSSQQSNIICTSLSADTRHLSDTQSHNSQIITEKEHNSTQALEKTKFFTNFFPVMAVQKNSTAVSTDTSASEDSEPFTTSTATTVTTTALKCARSNRVTTRVSYNNLPISVSPVPFLEHPLMNKLSLQNADGDSVIARNINGKVPQTRNSLDTAHDPNNYESRPEISNGSNRKGSGSNNNATFIAIDPHSERDKPLNIQLVASPTELMGSRTELMGSRTELMGSRTELMGSRAELKGNRTLFLHESNAAKHFDFNILPTRCEDKNSPILNRNYTEVTSKGSCTSKLDIKKDNRKIRTLLDNSNDCDCTGVSCTESQLSKTSFTPGYFQFPNDKTDILPLYRKTLSESNIFAKDRSNVDMLKRVVSRAAEDYVCKTAQPRMVKETVERNCDMSKLKSDNHRSILNVHYCEVNPFKWDVITNKNVQVNQ